MASNSNTSVRKPRPLKRGDLVEIVTPASPLDVSKVDDVTKLLLAQGYRVRLGEHALERDSYLAGSDQDRAQDLQGAFADPEVAAVLCSRGGYGCARLFPYLDLDAMASSGKMFLGFSDITTLHLALNRRGLPTVHAPMAITLSVPREHWVLQSFLRVLRGEMVVPADAPGGTTIVGGTAEGVVTGGCMCLLTDSLATADALDATGKILILEDVDEAPHRVDAMLTHMLNSGILQSAAGIVMGEMTRTDEKADQTIGPRPWQDIVIERIQPLGIPFIIGYPFGHMPNMLSLPLGIKAVLNADEGMLTYTEDLCESD
ncbi:MAG TPA: LD-carboxypeptidase [Fimbriimonadaceae bacterium]|jgi:muramoyltetrapeptide carboxypeptidase